MPCLHRLPLVSALSLLLMAAATQAHATSYAMTLVLHDVVFSDGGTASGAFSLDVYGYPSDSFSVTTSANGPFTGFTYDGSNSHPGISPPPPGADSVVAFQPLDLSLGADGLQLTFSGVLGTSQIVPIVTGSASCEFMDYGCPYSDTRTVVSGYATIPEPASLVTLTVGLMALRVARRRSGSQGA